VGSVTEYSIMCHVFEDLNFNRLCCEVLASNQSAIQMHKHFGFVQEGYFREHVMKGGQHVDVISLPFYEKNGNQENSKVENRLKRKGVL